MRVSEIVEALERLAPAALAESYDNVGLLIGEADTEAKEALLALELTDAVLDEALTKGCNVVITHHPIWFGKRNRLTGDDYASRLMLRAIRTHIAMIGIHTNLDNVAHGVNARIAKQIGLTNTSILQPSPKLFNGQVTGAGMIGDLNPALSPEALLDFLRDRFGCRVLRHTATKRIELARIAICGGAGSFLLEAAISAGAHALITSDIRYHTFFDAPDDFLLVDMGHYESEQFTPEVLLAFLAETFPTFAVQKSETVTNPIHYYC
jgi:dinuclear metal center YbgI/SA1388 family protein